MLDLATFQKLDRVIHEQGRLKIMALLAATETLAFSELKDYLGMTDGNLSVHMRTLEEAGYVTVRKSFVNRKPRTEYTLTAGGRDAFREYIQALGEIVRQSEPIQEAPPPREAPPVLKRGLAPAK